MGWLQNQNHIVVYADGSYHHSKGRCGGWAAIIVHGSEVKELSGHESPSTNNRMELMGIIKALQSIATGASVQVYTDSMYVQQGITAWIRAWKRRGWVTVKNKPVVNQDLWLQLDAEKERHLVSWHWVRGHDGDQFNERCDVLANAAAMKRYMGVV